MLRPLGIDNTVIVDVFKTMTQAQIDLQTQLEQATPTDLITRPLSNDSPVLYIETSEQTPPTFLEPMCNGCLIPSIDQTLRRPEFGARHCGSLPNTACFLD